MRKVNKRNVVISISVILFVVALFLGIMHVNTEVKTAKITDPEILRSLTYGELNEDDKKVDGTDNVQFSAFFTRDLDGDGYAERIKGACREITEKDTLYAEINVLSEGYLKDGKIVLNAKNFTWTTAIVNDNIIEGDYIGETNTITLKSIVNSGSQKLLWGTVASNLGDNINNYSQINSITLTGTHVIENEDGTTKETEINITREFIMDWHGTTKTEVNKYNNTSYQNQKRDIETLVEGENVVVKFNVAISETDKELVLQKQSTEVTIPKLNGFLPTSVVVTNKNVNYNYDEKSGILTIIREAEIYEGGNVKTSVARSNLNNVEVTYPLEAYTSLDVNTVSLNITVKGYNYGYNNSNEGFDNPYVSESNGVLTVTYSNPSGNLWNVYPYVGKLIRKNNIWRYEVSKEIPTGIYNGNKFEDIEDNYIVDWKVVVGDYDKTNNLILKEQNENENIKSDSFLSTSGKYDSMYNYVTTKGIYFQNAQGLLGEDGWIKLYNSELDTLIETFTAENWNNYTEDRPYLINLKSIKIETSKPVNNTTFDIYQIKEIDDKLVTTEGYTKEQFEDLAYIYTYVEGTIVSENSNERNEIKKSAFAYYEMPYSVQKLSVEPESITNQETKVVNFKIETKVTNEFEKEWKNGIFLLELPEEIINASINDVKVSDDSVKIQSYSVYENEGKYFIKVNTENETESVFTITVNANISANPLLPTNTAKVKLYAYNEILNNYNYNGEDKYDVNNDGNNTDFIGYTEKEISLIAPSGLLTTEYITDYDTKSSRVIAPNVAEIEKSDENKTAKININLTNNYIGTIDELVILGKIPFNGNTSTYTGRDLNSEFTSQILGEVIIPDELKQYTKVYYSTVEEPTKNIEDENNKWVVSSDVEDWTLIRTYLIDLGSYKLSKEEKQVFSYDVKIPNSVSYNEVSFSSHIVYFSLDTEEGKIQTFTEPNKVGIQVVGKYNLELTKNQAGEDNIFVEGATYKVTTTNALGDKISRVAITNEYGILTIYGLYIEKNYTLEEIACSSDYELNKNTIEFNTEFNTEKLNVTVNSGKFKETPNVIRDENGNYLLKAKVEDEIKYTINIKKSDENGELLEGVKFLLEGKGKKSTIITDENGYASVSGLCANEVYRLQEIKADGYYIDQAPRVFRIVRDGNKAWIESDDIELSGAKAEKNQDLIQPQIDFEIKNQKIPTFNLTILKVSESNDDEEIESLANAYFKLVGDDNLIQKEYKTDENGLIQINDLYAHEDDRYVTGRYLLQETKATEGYVNNSEEIYFVVTKNNDGTFKIDIENEEELTSYKSVQIDGNNITITIEDLKIFTLVKKDSETGNLLKDAQFIIYEIDSKRKIKDYAKDGNGIYIGEKNENGDYVVTTDDNGQITLQLRKGLYKIVEVTYPKGYLEESNEEYFKIGHGISLGSTLIYSIEDLVDFANDVNSGNDYSNKEVVLMNSLDTKEDYSYKNPNDTRFGDINGDGTIEGIKAELQNPGDLVYVNDSWVITNGFHSIGDSENTCFSGIFDGNGKEIKNLAMVNYSGRLLRFIWIY